MQVVVGNWHSRRPSILGKTAANVLNARQAQLGGPGIESSQDIIRNITDQNVTHNPMISCDIARVMRRALATF
jgi:hypothetical protein